MNGRPWLVCGKPLANVPSAQSHPTRLSADDEVLKQVASAYQVGVEELLSADN
ncbi:MAG: hypothetical protein ABL983_24130 [Nitrospira sp.]